MPVNFNLNNRSSWLKVLTWVVVVYILSAFGWWTYSLVTYSRTEYNLNQELLNDQCKVYHNKLVEGVLRGFFDTGQAIPFKHGRAVFMGDTQQMKDFIKTRSNNRNVLSFKDTGILEHRLVVSVSESALNKILDKYQHRRNGFLMEGLSLTILVLLAVFWLYRQMNNIMTFNQQQNNFLLAITHELKTPVAAVKLALQTLDRPNLPEDAHKKLVHTALQNADRLNLLMDNVLIATRLEGNALKLENHTVNMREVLLNEADRLRSNPAFEGNIRTELPDSFTVTGDAMALHLVIANLLSNAAKYSEGPADILVLAYMEDAHPVVEILDQGVGIPKEYRKKVFEKFYRMGDESVRRTKGTGLGLYLVRKILDEHRASIGIGNNKPKGTRFIIKFRY